MSGDTPDTFSYEEGLPPGTQPPVASKQIAIPDTFSYEEGLPSGSARQPTISSLAASPGVGSNKALAGAISLPANIVNAGVNAIADPFRTAGRLYGDVTGAPKQPITPLRPFDPNVGNRVLGTIGMNPAEHPPQSAWESVGQGAGEGAGAMMLPEIAAGRAALAAPRAMEPVQELFGQAKSLPAFAGNAAVGATSGAASAGAYQLPIPESWKPTVATIAGLGAGVGVAGMPMLAREGASS